MSPRFREIHREEIKNLMYATVHGRTGRWNIFFGGFIPGVMCASFGVSFCLIPRSGACFIGAVLFILSALFFALYLWVFRSHQAQGNVREWLNLSDHLIVTAILSSSIVFSTYTHSKMWLLLYIMAVAYAAWRFYKYSRPLWRSFYFRAGREYFRKIKSYCPNSAVKRNVKPPL